jgi:gas vesicle protein
MGKILLGALVCAAVAGVVAYLVAPDKFTETVDNLKSKADDALGKVKSGFSRAEADMSSTVS